MFLLSQDEKVIVPINRVILYVNSSSIFARSLTITENGVTGDGYMVLGKYTNEERAKQILIKILRMVVSEKSVFNMPKE